MNLTEGYLLRIFIGESDKQDGIPLYSWLVKRARQEKLAGATVFRGLEGFGAHSQIHTARILQLSTDLPIVVELIDSMSKIENFMLIIDNVIKDGLATLEKVQMKLYQ